MTKIKLELITDPDMYVFLEKCKRVGISYIYNGYSRASNKYLTSYKPKQEPKHIIYWDANDLYGYAISELYPTSGFKWIDPEEFYWIKDTSNSLKGYVLGTNHQYSKELQELQNDYSLASDKIEIRKEVLSHYQLKIADSYNIPIDNGKKISP